MTRALKLALAAAVVAGVAVALAEAARRRRGPSALSETLEHEDRAHDETEMGVDPCAFDDSIAPGAPL
ncbi:MAG: hypothetical protein H7Y89_14550 [Steroidobacteraceae bacterium]|nr:hypothetical protein [Steroidobacteraceae bacterium]